MELTFKKKDLVDNYLKAHGLTVKLWLDNFIHIYHSDKDDNPEIIKLEGASDDQLANVELAYNLLFEKFLEAA